MSRRNDGGEALSPYRHNQLNRQIIGLLERERVPVRGEKSGTSSAARASVATT